MTNNRVNRGHLSGILLVAAAILSAHPYAVFSQDVESLFPSARRLKYDPSSLPDQDKDHRPLADDAVVATLPDAPMPQDQAQDQSPPSPADSGTHLNQFPILSPGRTRAPLTMQDKFLIYAHKSFGPPAVILPAFGAGLGMLNPPSKYPNDWKDGASAFGRNYGYRLADRLSRNTAQFLAGALLHEDPRYLRSTSSNPLVRTVHTRNSTWRASSCRSGLEISLLSSNPNGDLGPKSFAFPKSCRVGGSGSTNIANLFWKLGFHWQPQVSLRRPFGGRHTDYRELENGMKLSCVVLIMVCAMATIAAQVNSVQTATADAPTPASSNTPAQVAMQE